MTKVSLILTTYNCREHFKITMQSILLQDYPEIEIVIVDGISTDGTVDIIREYAEKYPDKIVWISEADTGIYDAMNKGYHMSSGEIIAFFNDRFVRRDAVFHMVSAIGNGGAECMGAHADLIYADGKRVVRYWKMGNGLIRRGWMPGHPTLYVKRWVYEMYGLYHSQYRCSADYEFMVRAFYGREERLVYVPEIIVSMYYGGTSTGGMKNYLLSLKEAKRALQENGVRWAGWISLKRTARVWGQFIKAKRCDYEKLGGESI